RGNDVAFMGAGDDTFRWDPGDGSDVVEGQDGSDTLLFNGSNGGETVDLSANGDRFIFLRQPGNITMRSEERRAGEESGLGGAESLSPESSATMPSTETKPTISPSWAPATTHSGGTRATGAML